MKLLDSHSKRRHCVNYLLAHSVSDYQDSLAELYETGKGVGMDWREAVQSSENEKKKKKNAKRNQS